MCGLAYIESVTMKVKFAKNTVLYLTKKDILPYVSTFTRFK